MRNIICLSKRALYLLWWTNPPKAITVKTVKWFFVFLEELSESIMVILVLVEKLEKQIFQRPGMVFTLQKYRLDTVHVPWQQNTKIKSLLNIYIKAWLINPMFSSISGVSSKCHQFWFFFQWNIKISSGIVDRVLWLEALSEHEDPQSRDLKVKWERGFSYPRNLFTTVGSH